MTNSPNATNSPNGTTGGGGGGGGGQVIIDEEFCSRYYYNVAGYLKCMFGFANQSMMAHTKNKTVLEEVKAVFECINGVREAMMKRENGGDVVIAKRQLDECVKKNGAGGGINPKKPDGSDVNINDYTNDAPEIVPIFNLFFMLAFSYAFSAAVSPEVK